MEDRKQIILDYLKLYGFTLVEGTTNTYKQGRSDSRMTIAMFVTLTDNQIEFYTTISTWRTSKQTSFDRYDYNKLSKKEFNIFTRMILNMLSFFEKI